MVVAWQCGHARGHHRTVEGPERRRVRRGGNHAHLRCAEQRGEQYRIPVAGVDGYVCARRVRGAAPGHGCGYGHGHGLALWRTAGGAGHGRAKNVEQNSHAQRRPEHGRDVPRRCAPGAGRVRAGRADRQPDKKGGSRRPARLDRAPGPVDAVRGAHRRHRADGQARGAGGGGARAGPLLT